MWLKIYVKRIGEDFSDFKRGKTQNRRHKAKTAYYTNPDIKLLCRI